VARSLPRGPRLGRARDPALRPRLLSQQPRLR
jgi:hypothetical protein